MTNVTFHKFDLPHYALHDELNEMVQKYSIIWIILSKDLIFYVLGFSTR